MILLSRFWYIWLLAKRIKKFMTTTTIFIFILFNDTYLLLVLYCFNLPIYLFMYVISGFWSQSKLRVHQLWYVQLGFPVSFPLDDSRLLGRTVSKCVTYCWTMAYHLFCCHHFPWILLFGQPDFSHRSHELRRTPKEGRRRRRGCSSGRGGFKGKWSFDTHFSDGSG